MSAWASPGCTWLRKSCKPLPLPPHGFSSTSTRQGRGSRVGGPPAAKSQPERAASPTGHQGAWGHSAGHREETGPEVPPQERRAPGSGLQQGAPGAPGGAGPPTPLSLLPFLPVSGHTRDPGSPQALSLVRLNGHASWLGREGTPLLLFPARPPQTWIHDLDPRLRLPRAPRRCRGAALGGRSCLQLLIGAAQAGVAVPAGGLALPAPSPGCGGTRIIRSGCRI